jgi:hypothetical protein
VICPGVVHSQAKWHHDHSCSRFGAADVGATHSMVAPVFLVLQPDIIVDEEPNADAATDRVAGCCMEHR